MKLEVGMYIRTKDGIIARIKEIDNNERLYLNQKSIYTDDYEHDLIIDYEVIKASYNIIDILEEGDYVNGYKVSLKGYDYAHFVQCDYPVENGTTNHYKFYEQAIKSVVTKEMYKDMKYRIGE